MTSTVCTFGGEPTNLKEAHLLQSIPSKIFYTGPADVSGYFKPEDDEGTQRAAFRGKGLEACDVTLPEGYSLYAMKKREGNREVYDIDAKYSTFKVWEWDKIAEKDGSRTTVSKAMAYLKMAEALASDE